MLGLRRHRAIPCLSCGYDVTGLAPEGLCPECALPLKSTLEASSLLRTCPPEVVRGCWIGTWLLALSPTCLAIGLALGLWIALVWWTFSDSGPWMGVAIGMIVGWGGSALALVAGTARLIRSMRGRALQSAWALPVLRVAGPLSIAMGCAAMILRWNGLGFDSMILVAVFQLSTLGSLASLVRTAETIWNQTQATAKSPPRSWFCWSVVALLGVAWIITPWLVPIGMRRFVSPLTRLSLGDYAEILAAAAFVLVSGFLWRLVDAVSLEWTIREYTSGATSRA